MSVWEGLVGAEAAVERLRRDLQSGRVSHAYLFAGAAGRVPLDAALAFAAALACPDDGCGVCEVCRRVRQHLHPDVEVVTPAGMQLLVEQVRDVVRAAWRRPVSADRRMIVVDGADRMNPNAQNAFLKALEEPPPSTTIVLVTAAPEALLETVRSRCREVVFRSPTEREVAESLVLDGVDAGRARLLASAAGNLDRAMELAAEPESLKRRREVVERAFRPGRDPGEALESAEWLAQLARATREAVAEAHKQAASEYADWYQETKKASDDRLRREQRRAEQEALVAALDDIASVLRDLLAVRHAESPLLNSELRPALEATAERLGAETDRRVLEALTTVETVRRRLRVNANVQLQLEQVFLALHRALEGA